MGWKNDQVTEQETSEILELARNALGLPGDYVEMGCYKGDTSLLLAELLKDYNVEKAVENNVEEMGKNGEKVVDKNKGEKKRLWIYDSFEGLPEKSGFDKSVLGENFQAGELMATKKEVKQRFLRAGLPVPVIKKAWFEELEAEDLPPLISFAFLDGDFYESIKCCLKLVEKRMVDGGIVIVHDYNNPALPGVKKAVDEWGKSGAGSFRVVLL